ncbi:MAG: Smr/MutS family protein, partial [Bacillota bacterium]
AFEIALRLGLPAAIVEQAKGYINREDMEVEGIIADLNSERKKYRNLRMEVEAEKNKYSDLRQKYEQKLSRLEQKEEEIVSQARNRAESIVDRARKETKRILRELKQQDYAVRSEVDREENRINDQIKELEDRFFEEEEAREVLTDGEQIEVGDQVRVKSVGQKGEVLEVDREQGQARIQAGVMKVTTGLEELEKVEIPEDHSQEMARNYRVDKSSNVSQRLDLRGERYHLAQQQLDKYLDDALLAGFKQVEIIHGKGTGALRQAVQETLEDHPHISSFRLGTQKEGGAGVTIAELSP